MKLNALTRRSAVIAAGSMAALSLLATGPSSATAAPAAAGAVSVARAVTGDSDGDGLKDVWEKNGIDADGDGVVDVDLPAMGASPTHKDIFVEMDFMRGRLPSAAVLDRIVASFAAAPVSNPDRTTGIRLHLDGGPAAGGRFDLGGGGQVATIEVLPEEPDEEFAELKADHFASARGRAFHYMIWAEKYGDGCSSGVSFHLPGNEFLVTLGTECYGGDSAARLANAQVGTFIHELGHDLGLEHGGADDENYKPHYLSVMNYAYQFGGVPLAGGGSSYSYSDLSLPTLAETSLAEANPFGKVASRYRVAWYCPGMDPDDDDDPRLALAGGNIDWNCDGRISSSRIRANINGDYNGRRAIYGKLTSQNDWARLVYDGGSIGGPGNRSGRSTTVEEPSQDELVHGHAH